MKESSTTNSLEEAGKLIFNPPEASGIKTQTSKMLLSRLWVTPQLFGSDRRRGRIMLSAMVRGNEANTEFTVTEVYTKQTSDWKLLALTFSSVRDTHVIKH